jgi:hypothetical protein
MKQKFSLNSSREYLRTSKLLLACNKTILMTQKLKEKYFGKRQNYNVMEY